MRSSGRLRPGRARSRQPAQARDGGVSHSRPVEVHEPEAGTPVSARDEDVAVREVPEEDAALVQIPGEPGEGGDDLLEPVRERRGGPGGVVAAEKPAADLLGAFEPARDVPALVADAAHGERLGRVDPPGAESPRASRTSARPGRVPPETADLLDDRGDPLAVALVDRLDDLVPSGMAHSTRRKRQRIRERRHGPRRSSATSPPTRCRSTTTRRESRPSFQCSRSLSSARTNAPGVLSTQSARSRSVLKCSVFRRRTRIG